MNKKKDKEFSLIIVPNGRGKVKLLKFNTTHLYVFLLLIVAFLIVTSFIFVDYGRTKNALYALKAKNLSTLSEVKSKEIELLQKEVAEQSAKIDAFEEYIAYLSSLGLEVKKMAMIPGVPVSVEELFQQKKKEIAYTLEGAEAKVVENQIKIKGLEDKAKNLEMSLSALKEALKEYNDILDHTPNIWPVVGPIESDFGWRTHPVYKTPDYHTGVDIDAVEGTPIRAAASGVVILSGWNGGYGIEVEIVHRKGLSTVYGHLLKSLVKPGQKVKKGEIIGYVGMTGVATDPHLHYEVRVNGLPVDPKPYLPGASNP
ncbi:MAG: peptidoglycan DD-metalloendopeptidase family protein [Caldisericia bacterium]|nr:peptidoglycan DD-metalloendopeptidase family protein [Caldisericia bacterium]